jgi:hypothetical protein
LSHRRRRTVKAIRTTSGGSRVALVGLFLTTVACEHVISGHRASNRAAILRGWPDQPRRAGNMNWLALCTLLVLMLGSNGCVLPLPRKVEFGRKIESSDISLVKVGVTTRSEIAASFGVPDRVFDKPPVSVYWWWERVGVYFIGEPFFGLGQADSIHRTGLLLVLFDDEGQVRKVQICYAPRSGVTEQFISKWISAE